jgi:hypothetical protein
LRKEFVRRRAEKSARGERFTAWRGLVQAVEGVLSLLRGQRRGTATPAAGRGVNDQDRLGHPMLTATSWAEVLAMP